MFNFFGITKVQKISRHRRETCPGGTVDNSQTLQRWVKSHYLASPEGTAEPGTRHFQPSLRDLVCFFHRQPNAKALGYFQASLRDAIELRNGTELVRLCFLEF